MKITRSHELYTFRLMHALPVPELYMCCCMQADALIRALEGFGRGPWDGEKESSMHAVEALAKVFSCSMSLEKQAARLLRGVRLQKSPVLTGALGICYEDIPCPRM